MWLLRKIFLRSDSIWAKKIAFKSFLKYIPLFFDTYALMKSQYWPREKIVQLQDDRLRDLFHDATAVPFWKKTFESAKIDVSMAPREILKRLPVASKKD